MQRHDCNPLQAPVFDLVGDGAGFYRDLEHELKRVGLDVARTTISHLGYKAKTFEEYWGLRDALLAYCAEYVEDVHNGRPIAKMIVAHPLRLGEDRVVDMIELMPPKDKPAKRLGLEHVGFVVGARLEEFVAEHWHVLTGRQDQGPYCQPAYITFPSGRRAKFYDKPLRTVLELEGHRFVAPQGGGGR